ncbi:MAG: hypothetical protein HYU26_01785 [Candidatus Rokubacteria bacterium]|nr:hypothetical protein [Candidatus Rokubacteria bacterium]
MPKTELDTPALLIDLPTFERNLETMRALAAGAGVVYLRSPVFHLFLSPQCPKRYVVPTPRRPSSKASATVVILLRAA